MKSQLFLVILTTTVVLTGCKTTPDTQVHGLVQYDGIHTISQPPVRRTVDGNTLRKRRHLRRLEDMAYAYEEVMWAIEQRANLKEFADAHGLSPEELETILWQKHPQLARQMQSYQQRVGYDRWGASAAYSYDPTSGSYFMPSTEVGIGSNLHLGLQNSQPMAPSPGYQNQEGLGSNLAPSPGYQAPGNDAQPLAPTPGYQGPGNGGQPFAPTPGYRAPGNGGQPLAPTPGYQAPRNGGQPNAPSPGYQAPGNGGQPNAPTPNYRPQNESKPLFGPVLAVFGLNRANSDQGVTQASSYSASAGASGSFGGSQRASSRERKLFGQKFTPIDGGYTETGGPVDVTTTHGIGVQVDAQATFDSSLAGSPGYQ